MIKPAYLPANPSSRKFLERRAAPFSQNIRKAFEVLVGAARVAASVTQSERQIAANEAKRQKMIQAATDGEVAAAAAAP